MKHKKHDKILRDFDSQKSKNLEKLATKMLDRDEKNQKLKRKFTNTKWLDIF
jgi:hypothetical protein